MYISCQSESLRQLILLAPFTDKQTEAQRQDSPPHVTQLEARSCRGWIRTKNYSCKRRPPCNNITVSSLLPSSP